MVFVSYARHDLPQAMRFVDSLERHGLKGFVDTRDIPPGANVVATIDEALSECDYFVLLWSCAARNREWVTIEWSAALVRGVRERRSFLFVVRLDSTDLPLTLASNQYLDAPDNPDLAVKTLVEAWRRDRDEPVPVLPAPHPLHPDGGATVVLHVYNQMLEVTHKAVVPVESTARELLNRLRVELALPDDVSAHGNRVGMRFSYRLAHEGKPLRDNDTFAAVGMLAEPRLNLEVHRTDFSPEGTDGTRVYRAGTSSKLSAPLVEMLIRDAFGHLLPWRRTASRSRP